MFLGMINGMFTGKKLKDYFHDVSADWVNARRIINGLDRANDIAAYAKKFLAALEAAV
jgi:putative chitinase